MGHLLISDALAVARHVRNPQSRDRGLDRRVSSLLHHALRSSDRRHRAHRLTVTSHR